MQQFVDLIEYPDYIMYGIANAADKAFGPAVAVFDAGLRTVLPGPMAWMDNHANTSAHPLSKKLPLMTPAPMLFSLVLYFAVLGLCLLIVKARGSEFGLRTTSLLHNAILTAVSLYMMVGILATAAVSFPTLWNNAAPTTGKNAWTMAKFINMFYLSKILEFADTWLMALRGHKPFVDGSKISFLHVYHHASIFPIWYFVTLEGPGGDAWWSAMANSFIHVIMYAYMTATCLPKGHAIRELFDPVRFYITRMQMFQFFLNNVQSGYLIYLGKASQYPIHLVHLLFWYMLSLLALFYNFLRVNEAKAKAAKKAAAASAAAGDAKESSQPRTSIENKKKKTA
jgi:elongation of very long chain fatty acids protein 4